jgi:repressor LexA
LKRLIKQSGKVFLKAENKNYPDLMPVNELVIQGLAKTVMRRI